MMSGLRQRRDVAMRTGLLALFALILMTPHLLAYTVESGHPRVYFTSSGLQEIRDKCGPGGPLELRYDNHRNKADLWLGEGMSGWGPETFSDRLGMYSFFYIVEEDTTYLNEAMRIADECVTREFVLSGQSYPWSELVETYRGMAVFYDWCYAGLDSTERSEYADSLAVAATFQLEEERAEWASNLAHSKASRLGRLAWGGLALYGDAEHGALAAEMCDSLRVHLYGEHQGQIPFFDAMVGDGGWYSQDYFYNVFCVEGYIATAWLWEVATDDSPFSDSSHLANIGRHLAWSQLAWLPAGESPTRDAGFCGTKYGDAKAHLIPDPGRMVIVCEMLAAATQDSVTKWLAEQHPSAYGWDNRYAYIHLIVKDPELGSASPEEAGWGSSALFDSTGVVFMRSGWDMDHESTQVFAALRAERFIAADGHMHAHQGHFLIARGNDVLAIDIGRYEGGTTSHHRNYESRTIAHNCPTVYMPGESFDGFANDGGQIRVEDWEGITSYMTTADWAAYDHEPSRIVEYESSSQYTYSKADLTHGYNPAKVDTVTREFVWLKPDEGAEDTSLFVVFDRVSSDDEDYKKAWSCHSISDPSVADSTLVTIDEGSSRLFVAPIYPIARSIEEIGGSAYEFYVDGTNYPPGAPLADSGQWRVEVSPTVAAKDDWFLVALYACADTTSAMPPVTAVSRADNRLGCAIGGSDPDTLWFGKDGESFIYSPWTPGTGCPEESPPGRAGGMSAHPNPLRPTTTLTLDVPYPGGAVAVAIYDVSGRRVWQADFEHLSAGIHEFQWNATNDSGDRLPSGVYFCRITGPGFEQAKKITLLK